LAAAALIAVVLAGWSAPASEPQLPASQISPASVRPSPLGSASIGATQHARPDAAPSLPTRAARLWLPAALALAAVVALATVGREAGAGGVFDLASPFGVPRVGVRRALDEGLLFYRATRARIQRPAFPNYLEMRRRLPIAAWHGIRVVSVGVFFTLCVALWIRPAGALFFFWRCLVPGLPLLFFVAPGLWRNICPLAAANQTPRLLGFTRGRTLPAWLRQRSYLIAMATFLLIVPTRRIAFNKSGPALSLLLLVEIGIAFVGGVAFKGKSGFCASICPLLPVQRVYGQTPFALVPNSHCQPCVGCAKNCYDFNPGVAYQADLADGDVDWSQARKVFAGALPGAIIGFFAVGAKADALQIYGWFFASVLISVGLLFVVDSYLRLKPAMVTALWGATALNLFYWYQARPVAQAVTQITGHHIPLLAWLLRAVVFGLSVVWLRRTAGVQRKFTSQGVVHHEPVAPPTVKGAGIEVRFAPDDSRAFAKAGQSLLEVAEAARLPIEVGCRMGMCGADPIAVVEGLDRLSPIEEVEAKTLDRLGLAANTRMACCARVNGPVCVSLAPEKADPNGRRAAPVNADPSIRSVVVIGCGVAGVTTADFVRRRHPECDIHLVGREAHPLYNRMGISRLIHGRSAMQGLYLLADNWYEDNRVTLWLNTKVTGISTGRHSVSLGTGERLDFDRLVIATGSASATPPIDGMWRPGTFVLREASDAIAIRAYAQEHAVRTAVVVGGGLLGLEAAYALRALGLRTIVLDRGERLLGQQVDRRASELLGAHLRQLGIRVRPGTQARHIRGKGRVEQVLLDDGSTVACGMVLVCAGISPNVDLARDAGIDVNRGIVVDRRLQTSVPGVYAVGDCAELEGSVTGLWPVATRQAEVAAANLLGGSDETYDPAPQPVILKGVGIDLVSVGRVEAGPHDTVITLEDGAFEYRKLIVDGDGLLAGALVIGRPQDARLVMAAVPKAVAVSSRLDTLRSGDWGVLDTLTVARCR
jgi:nitrite reductase (NADH) large subunit